MLKFLVLAALALSSAAMDCPSSPVMQHSGCEMTTAFTASCSAVKSEVLQRVNGQYDRWHDPHNNGTYTTANTAADSVFDLERVTGDQKYTDKIRFTFSDNASGCTLEACSESQVFSISDFGTNYCNSHDLYCADAGCHPFTELKFTESFGKCTDHSSSSACLTV